MGREHWILTGYWELATVFEYVNDMIERFSFEQGEEKVRKWNVQRLLQSTCWRITGSDSGFGFKALGWMISVKPLLSFLSFA